MISTNADPRTARHLDVLIIGAGISGIGAACHLTMHRPNTRFAVLESRETLGGTWSLFRYPGIRSDSDMQTFGYGFRPWTHRKAIADGHLILDYLQQTADEYGVTPQIRFGHKVLAADFSTATGLWTVKVQKAGQDAPELLTARFLFAGTGYYDYDAGYTPDFPGRDDFAGRIVHPQHWPQDLDYTDKRVVVIGSGATAVTLIPSMAGKARHVTMLQRSPGYVFSMPAEDAIANALHRLLPTQLAHRAIRAKNIFIIRRLFRYSRRWPKTMRRLLIGNLRRQLPKTFDVATHFTPSYNPWEQRLCVVPDGDMFKAIAAGKASVATDQIERFTKTGILLQSGQELAADIIVTATGLNMLPLGRMALRVDGQPVSLPDTVIYKGMMLSGVPNFAFVAGYTNISWTLKADLVSEHFCRLLDYMDQHDHDIVVPVLDDPAMARRPLMDLKAGYVSRGVGTFPHNGTSGVWASDMAYEQDRARLRHGPVTDPALHFGRLSLAIAAE